MERKISFSMISTGETPVNEQFSTFRFYMNSVLDSVILLAACEIVVLVRAYRELYLLAKSEIVFQ